MAALPQDLSATRPRCRSRGAHGLPFQPAILACRTADSRSHGAWKTPGFGNDRGAFHDCGASAGRESKGCPDTVVSTQRLFAPAEQAFHADTAPFRAARRRLVAARWPTRRAL